MYYMWKKVFHEFPLIFCLSCHQSSLCAKLQRFGAARGLFQAIARATGSWLRWRCCTEVARTMLNNAEHVKLLIVGHFLECRLTARPGFLGTEGAKKACESWWSVFRHI